MSVYQDSDSQDRADTEWALILDNAHDAILLQDVLTKAAKECEKRAVDQRFHASIAPTGRGKTRSLVAAVGNEETALVYRKYAERCEHIRLQRVEEIVARLATTREEKS